LRLLKINEMSDLFVSSEISPMTTTSVILKRMAAVRRSEQDWLFEKLLGKMNAHRYLILSEFEIVACSGRLRSNP
jgi:hypothetical protein